MDNNKSFLFFMALLFIGGVLVSIAISGYRIQRDLRQDVPPTVKVVVVPASPSPVTVR